MNKYQKFKKFRKMDLFYLVFLGLKIHQGNNLEMLLKIVKKQALMLLWLQGIIKLQLQILLIKLGLSNKKKGELLKHLNL